MGAVVTPRLPVAAGRQGAVVAEIGPLPGFDDRPVAWFRGSITADDTAAVARTIHAGVEAGIPVVGIVERMGLDAKAGLSALVGWGEISRELAAASGVVPTLLIVDGPCLGGPAMAVGLVDIVVMTRRGALFINRPESSARMTGTTDVDPERLGDSYNHSQSGVADMVVDEVDDAIDVVCDILSVLPTNSLSLARVFACPDPVERLCRKAANAVPEAPSASYDVRDVIGDIVDDGWFLELRPKFGASMVVGFSRIGGQSVGIVANQPNQLAGALDIDSSLKGARFVRWCDAFNIPLLTLVDTPGFRPGRDQEWQGIVRHGAKLAFAYAEATVPRVSLVLRKAYGGAYIVMDSKGMGNDCALAWPSAEIAVMGAKGAVEIVHRRALLALPEHEREAQRLTLEADYAAEHLSPRVAAERGFIDAVIDPASTRQVIAEALAALATKRERPSNRRHDNVPL